MLVTGLPPKAEGGKGVSVWVRGTLVGVHFPDSATAERFRAAVQQGIDAVNDPGKLFLENAQKHGLLTKPNPSDQE
jgi:hypothetical protein